MKSTSRLASLSSLSCIVLCGLVSGSLVMGCSSSSEDDSDEANGAATVHGTPPDYESQADYASTPFLGGSNIKEWVVRGDTAASAEIARLWISRDGAFTVAFPAPEKPWNGAFKADKASVTLTIVNDGGSASSATSPIKGAWSFAATGGTITLSRSGSTSIVITAAP